MNGSYMPLLAHAPMHPDIITESSTHANCVTKHYSKNMIGAGSVLASEAFVRRFCSVDKRGRTFLETDPTAVNCAPREAVGASGRSERGGLEAEEGAETSRGGGACNSTSEDEALLSEVRILAHIQLVWLLSPALNYNIYLYAAVVPSPCRSASSPLGRWPT